MKRSKAQRLLTIEATLRDIAGTIGPLFPQGTCFALMVFDVGDKGHASYITNARREDMIKALREQADRLEHGAVAPHGAPQHPHNNPGDA